MSQQAPDRHDAPPAIFEHATRTWDYLYEQSFVEDSGDGPIRIWEGSLTKVITDDLGLSNPYYTKITTLLRAAGCLEMLKRGGGGSVSRWMIRTKPDTELLYRTVQHLDSRSNQRFEAERAQEQRLKDINTRVLELEDEIEMLRERMDILEARGLVA